jgi:hypothetical protein
MAPKDLHGTVRNQNLFFEFKLPENSQTVIFALSWLDVPALPTTHATVVYQNVAQLAGQASVDGIFRPDKTFSFTLDNGAIITGHLMGDAEAPVPGFKGWSGQWLTPYNG